MLPLSSEFCVIGSSKDAQQCISQGLPFPQIGKSLILGSASPILYWILHGDCSSGANRFISRAHMEIWLERAKNSSQLNSVQESPESMIVEAINSNFTHFFCRCLGKNGMWFYRTEEKKLYRLRAGESIKVEWGDLLLWGRPTKKFSQPVSINADALLKNSINIICVFSLFPASRRFGKFSLIDLLKKSPHSKHACKNYSYASRAVRDFLSQGGGSRKLFKSESATGILESQRENFYLGNVRKILSVSPDDSIPSNECCGQSLLEDIIPLQNNIPNSDYSFSKESQTEAAKVSSSKNINSLDMPAKGERLATKKYRSPVNQCAKNFLDGSFTLDSVSDLHTESFLAILLESSDPLHAFSESHDNGNLINEDGLLSSLQPNDPVWLGVENDVVSKVKERNLSENINLEHKLILGDLTKEINPLNPIERIKLNEQKRKIQALCEGVVAPVVGDSQIVLFDYQDMN